MKTGDLLKTQILETVRLHADTARAAYKSRDHEVALLKAEIHNLTQQLAFARAEARELRVELRKAGGVPITDAVAVR